MNQDIIFAPMGALALLTFIVLVMIPVQRFRATSKGEVTIDDFRLGESVRVPDAVAIPNRNYMNLLELPTLFYVVYLMFYVTHRVDLVVVGTAWAYVAARTLHSIVHLTYHNIVHRLTAFAVSNFALGTLWTLFFLKLR